MPIENARRRDCIGEVLRRLGIVTKRRNRTRPGASPKSTDTETIARLAARYGWSIEEATRRYRAANELARRYTDPVEYDAFMKKVERVWQSETERSNLVQGYEDQRKQ